ncbi:MAG: hypothetical protein IKU90_02910, partial [Clostridia bacterium]|nr:hypothetical protein [Clostridia bacterium]
GHSYNAVVTAPDCENGGYTTYTCACGDSYVADEVAAKGHSYNAVVTEPDCVNGGYTTYTCSVCGDSYVDDEVEANGHSYEAVVTKPDCVNGGYTTYICSVCGDSYVADEVAAKGHETGCGHYAMKGELEAALAANGTVNLEKPVTIEGGLTIGNGQVLNLNGQTLTVGGIVTFGNGMITDEGKNGAGKIIATKLHLGADGTKYEYTYNKVPVLVEENTYMLVEPVNQNYADHTTNTITFRPSLEIGKYTNADLFGGVTTNLTFGVVVYRAPADDVDNKVYADQIFEIEKTAVSAVYGETQQVMAFTVTLTGLSEGYVYGVEVVLCHGGVVVYQAELATLVTLKKPEEQGQ